ncbi:MAG: hypothetical protein M3271_01995 [Actinomycetota bacterium]|nr:hypothetical protein [Actinomycetota bacterium]
MRARLWVAVLMALLSFPEVAAAVATRDPRAVAPDPLPVAFADGIQHVANLSDPVAAVGARKVGDYFYVSSARGIHIYDVSTPESPRLTGSLDLLHDPYYPSEDVDTNGDVLLLGVSTSAEERGALLAVDVSDKSNPEIAGRLNRDGDHTVSCVLDCTYAYSDNGDVIFVGEGRNLLVAGNWMEGTGLAGGAHDVTEIAPGWIVTSSSPMLLLDAREDPTSPRVVAHAEVKDELLDSVYAHGNLWPRRGRDRFLLLGGEKVGPCSKTQNAGLFTYDVSRWRSEGVAEPVDSFRLDNGSPTDGNAPYNTNCAHWFDTHPRWRNGGLVAMAWYEHGTRLLQVDGAGRIEERGYFLPVDGSAWAAYWISDDVVYTVDYNRGVDVLEVTAEP